MLGWVAVSGHVEAGAVLLFLIILIWTPPHFWALAIHRRDDYARAGIPMLPVTHGVAFTARRIVTYTALLGVVSLLPVAFGAAGWPYLAGATLLGARFLALARRLQRDVRWAMPTFRYSIVYLGALFALLLVDHGIRIAG
jgi:protoheme IX farnesyltransferase